MDRGGTGFGSLRVNRIWGVLASSSGIPSISAIPSAVMAEGRQSVPPTYNT